MTISTNLSSMEVRGKITSTYQGTLIGAMSVMPDPSVNLNGCIIKYTGETSAGFEKFCSYACVLGTSGYEWVNADGAAAPSVTPSRVVISAYDGRITASEVSDSELAHLKGIGSNVQTQINEKLGKNEMATSAAKAIRDDQNRVISDTYATISTVNGKQNKVTYSASAPTPSEGASGDLWVQV